MADVAGPLKDDSAGTQLPQTVSALRSSRSVPRRTPGRVSIVVPKASHSIRHDRSPRSAQPLPGSPATSSSHDRPPDLSVTSTPWAKKLILTLDGGGIRGYSSLIILRTLMNEIAEIERTIAPHAASSAHTNRISSDMIPPEVYREGQYLPCHYFDYIAGTSVGGLIAIMLGMMGKSVDECIAEFLGQDKGIPLADDRLPSVAIDLPLLNRRSTWPTKRARSFFDTFAKFAVTSTSTSTTRIQPSSTRQASPVTPPTAAAATPPAAHVRRSSDSSSISTLAEFKKDTFQCQIMVWCAQVTDRSGTHRRAKRIPYAFCSYKEEDDDDGDDDNRDCTVRLPTSTRARTNTTVSSRNSLVSIPEVAKAITTPCSPSFKPFKLGSGQFVDGSRLIRDPTLGVIKEISSLLLQSDDDDETDEEDEEPISPKTTTTTTTPHHQDRDADSVRKYKKHDPPIDLLLSLGTDEHHAWFYEKLRRPAIEKSYSARRAQINEEEGLSYREYHRFEVQDIKLGLRKKYYLGQIEEATGKYLAERDVSEHIRRYAELLVERRRARAKTSRWETFALGVKYFCHHAVIDEDTGSGGEGKVVSGCNSVRAIEGFGSRGDFYEHLEKSHRLWEMAARKEVDIEAELDKGRRFGCT